MTFEHFTRDDWGALPAESVTPMSPSAVERIFVHWLGAATSSFGVSLLRSIQRFHQSGEFVDIAYSEVVDNQADSYEGRGLYRQDGATSPEWAGRSYSICVGFGPGQTISRDVLRTIVARARNMERVTGKRLPVSPHRHAYATECPGDFLAEWIARGMPTAGDGDSVKPGDDLSPEVPRLPKLGKDTVLVRRDHRNRWPWRKRRLHAMQRALSFLGYDLVGVGPWHSATARAIKSFKADHSLPGNGNEVDHEFWMALSRELRRARRRAQ